MCLPDATLNELASSNFAIPQRQILSDALKLAGKSSLCDLSVWHNESENGIYKAFQDLAYLNIRSPISLLTGDALWLLCLLPVWRNI